MPSVEPRVIARLGSHAEKEYLEKTGRLLDGLIIGANLVESTPGATGSLIVKLGGDTTSLRYYVDPMTYAFGLYVDPATGKLRSDLDWIKSEQKESRKSKKVVRNYKKSYKALADQYGPPFDTALDRGTAVTWDDFKNDAKAVTACSSIVNYQLQRIKDGFSSDPEFAKYAAYVPKPAAVFAPYFYIDPVNATQWESLVLRLARMTVELNVGVPVHAVICVDELFLADDAFVKRLIELLPGTGVAGVWLWFSKLKEDEASKNQLQNLRALAEALSRKMEVYNMHGGFFSLALCKYGLSGISHGVGYGEQKDVVPVIGQSTPTVRYYLPAGYKRFGVPEIERAFAGLGIRTVADFHREVCSCVVCKGVVSTDIADFQSFGELRLSTPQSKRLAQTPAAAKRCRYHFLLNRIRERDWLKTASVTDIHKALEATLTTWGGQPSVQDQLRNLPVWAAVLQ